MSSPLLPTTNLAALQSRNRPPPSVRFSLSLYGRFKSTSILIGERKRLKFRFRWAEHAVGNNNPSALTLPTLSKRIEEKKNRQPLACFSTPGIEKIRLRPYYVLESERGTGENSKHPLDREEEEKKDKKRLTHPSTRERDRKSKSIKTSTRSEQGNAGFTQGLRARLCSCCRSHDLSRTPTPGYSNSPVPPLLSRPFFFSPFSDFLSQPFLVRPFREGENAQCYIPGHLPKVTLLLLLQRRRNLSALVNLPLHRAQNR